MTRDCIQLGEGKSVMHQPVAGPEAPERCCLNRLCGPLVFGQGQEWDAVAGADVVQQKVAKRMNGFIRQSIRNAERTAINGRARGRGGNVRDVTNAATDLVKVSFTGED